MDFQKIHAANFTISCLLLLGLLYVFVGTPSLDKPLFSFRNYQCRSSTSKIMEESGEGRHSRNDRDELERALSKASMADKTVIVAMINKAYVEVEGEKMRMLDLFLEAFWLGEGTQGLVDHLLLVAVDQTSFQRCTFLHLHCYKLDTHGLDFTQEKIYLSQDFITMMWTRTLFLSQLLKRGYSFIFTDIDVMWLRNPLPRLALNQSIDLQISTDDFNGDEWSESNHINTGFYMIKSNNKTIKLFEMWYEKRNSANGLKEQDVLDGMMKDGVFRELGVKTRFLDSDHFSGFCKDSKDFRAVTTVHATCCRGIRAKVADLTAVLHDWLRFKSLPGNETQGFQWTGHFACMHSW